MAFQVHIIFRKCKNIYYRKYISAFSVSNFRRSISLWTISFGVYYLNHRILYVVHMLCC